MPPRARSKAPEPAAEVMPEFNLKALLSDLAAGVTGEITYVDAGFNTVVGGMDIAAGKAEG